jgi:hypothetical protein
MEAVGDLDAVKAPAYLAGWHGAIILQGSHGINGKVVKISRAQGRKHFIQAAAGRGRMPGFVCRGDDAG